MARLPPNLSYLTIYNPTLTPTGPVPKDDEDAEEQAQILFYTSKERAVSRDTMLRQIGLAKALANFSEMFNGGEPCDSIHSQTRRMVMLCPEPDFWIHAGVELAKTPRAPVKGKGKGKEKESVVVYDYSDASVHDLALKADIMRGYERFKLTHGSFTSILSTQGRTALELQLERFFTPWAWSWDLEDGYEFGDHLGVPLHPKHAVLAPLLEEFSSTIPASMAPIFATSSCIIPSRRYMNGRLPHSLSRHLLSMIPPSPQTSNTRLPSDPDATLRTKQSVDAEAPKSPVNKKDSDPSSDSNRNSFMGIPAINMNVNMKWGWPGYLTFGKQSQSRPSAESVASQTSPSKEEQKEIPTSEQDDKDDKASVSSHPADAEVDKGALDDAMSSENVHVADQASVQQEHEASGVNSPESVTISELDKESSSDSEVMQELADSSREENENQGQDKLPSPPPPPPPPRPFMMATVHIADPDNPLLTQRRKVLHLSEESRMIALVNLDDEVPDPSVLETLSAKVDELFSEIKQTLEDDLSRSTSSDPSTPIARLLQQKDRYVIAMPQFILTESEKFSSKSQHLFNAQRFLESDLEIKEIFSRGQNPQHWHVGRKLGSDCGVYMEVFNKESSLTDVDNSLAGIVRRLDSFSDM
ncbi:hypothetical protein VNI00_002934 [Paramarasmius palmivorus]|uniref:CCZ1/INTU/HSP4 first Longin domain-containing protein n=1 Tax=Paramarasmius palmivorus TaxID=297713 RepID=A0AAW0DXX8_9AGAR